jgi:hypothetical protein
MKLAIVSESSADETAIATLVAGVLGTPIDVASFLVRKGGGWTTLMRALPSIVPAIYYATDVEGVVIVLDSDDSPIHDPDHDPADPNNAYCRICGITQLVARAKARLHDRPIDRPLRFAFGLAVPLLEAWFLCGRDPQVSEATWINARRQNTIAYTRPDLKRRLYGTDRPSLDQETSAMVREANRLAAGQLQLLEQLFPLGFGMLVTQLRTWQSTQTG